MGFEAFKVLKAEGETTPVYEQMLAVLLEEQEILRRFGSVLAHEPDEAQKNCASEIEQWFDDLNDEQKADLLQPARGYLSNLREHQLEPLEANSPILEAVLSQMKYEDDAKEWLRPAMSSLLNKSTQDLQTIQGALSNLEENQFNTFLDNFHEMASRIAGQNPNRLTDTYKILMNKLAEQDGNADIRVRLNAAYDEVAQKCQNLNPLQRGLSALKGLLLREPSLQNLPQTLVNPFASESPAAVSDAPAGGEASDETPDEAENQQSTPASSQQRQNPFQKLGQRIASLPWIGRIKTGALGIAAAAVITTHPLRQWIGHQRKGLLISAGGVAGVLGLGILAAKNLGSAPVPKPPAVDLAKTGKDIPIINIALETIENDFKKTHSGWVSLEQYLANSKINVINNNTQNNADIEKALITLKANMAKGGMASSDQAVKGATQRSIEKIAELTGINKKDFVNAYTNARDAVNGKMLDGTIVTNDTHTTAVHHEKMGKALDALSEKITQSRSSVDASASFSGGGGGGGDGTLIASADTGGIASDVPMGILPAQHQSPLATMMHGAVSRLEGVAHNVAVVAQHPAAQAAMRGLGVVGVVASVAKTVHEARSGNTALAVMNGAAAVATVAATVGMPPVAAIAGAARIGAYAADRSGAETLNRVTEQQQELTNKLATLKAGPQTLRSRVQTVTTHVALATKKADVLAAKTLNAARENVQSGVEATSQMLTQAQGVAGNAMETATNAFQSAQERTANMFANLFTQRQAAVL